MPNLFTLMPALERLPHPLLADRHIVAVGVSAVLYYKRSLAFEVTRPRHWGRRKDGGSIVGVGGIGGRIEPGESALTCLQREVREEIGVGFWLEPTPSTALIHEGVLATWLEFPATADTAAPYLVNLLPSQLERPDRPDHLAIVTFLGRLQAKPRRRDLFGLLMVDEEAAAPFFARPEWPLEEALALSGLTFELESSLPTDAVLRPTLTARAFQALLDHTAGLGGAE